MSKLSANRRNTRRRGGGAYSPPAFTPWVEIGNNRANLEYISRIMNEVFDQLSPRIKALIREHDCAYDDILLLAMHSEEAAYQRLKAAIERETRG